jgi:hypothetical protein
MPTSVRALIKVRSNLARPPDSENQPAVGRGGIGAAVVQAFERCALAADRSDGCGVGEDHVSVLGYDAALVAQKRLKT